MGRHHFLADALPIGRHPGRHFIPAADLLAADAARQQRIGDGATAEHDVGAAGFLLAADEVCHRPHLAIGDERDVDRRPHPVDRCPARRRAIAVGLGPAMDDQFVDAAGGQRLRAVDSQAGIVDAEAHFCRKRHVDRNHRAHGAGNLVEQFRLTQQRGAAAMAIDSRRRTAEIEVDAGRIQRHQTTGVLGHEIRIRSEQLDAHRRTGRGAAVGEQFRANALVGPDRQHAARHADEFADRPVVTADRRQHAAQQIVGEPFHRGEENAGHRKSGAVTIEVGIIVSPDWRNPAANLSSHRGKETDRLLTLCCRWFEMQVSKYQQPFQMHWPPTQSSA